MLLKARAEGDARRCAVVATVVSSSALGKMAEIEGFEFHQTATGFKNIGPKGHELKQQVRLRFFAPFLPASSSYLRIARAVLSLTLHSFLSLLLCGPPHVLV